MGLVRFAHFEIDEDGLAFGGFSPEGEDSFAAETELDVFA